MKLNRFKKWLATAFSITLIGGSLAACGSKGAGSKNELVMNYRTEPPALDVSVADSAASFTILGAVSEGLYRLDKDLKPQPALAKELPQISQDGLTYTIKLRDGIKWADGTPVTANDFVYSFQRSVDPRTKAYYGFMVAWIKGGNDVLSAKDGAAMEAAKKKMGARAIDEKTLEIKLEHPVPFFTDQLAFLTFFPQKKEFVDKWGEKSGSDVDKVLGAGPFTLKEWQHDKKLVLEKNPQYWDAAHVKLEKVTLNVVKNTDTGLNLYEAGDADYQVLSGNQFEPNKDRSDLVKKKELTTGYLNFQQTNVAAFKNKKIRQAFAASIDRKALVETIFQGSEPATGYVPTGNNDGNGKDFRSVAGDTEIQYDPAKAKQLLQEGLAEAHLTAMPKLNIMGDDNDPGPKMLEFLSGQWEQNLGVKVDIVSVPHPTRLEREMKLKDYLIVNTLWGADYNDPMTWLDTFITGASFNTGDWSNQEFDALIKSAQVEKDAAKRAQMLVTAEKILMDEAAVAPMYFRTLNILVKPRVHDLILPSFGAEFELKWVSLQ